MSDRSRSAGARPGSQRGARERAGATAVGGRRTAAARHAAPPLTRAEIEAEAPARRHTLTGNIRLHRAFPSRVLGRGRDVLVYLPPGYGDGTRRYPVLYFNDGQNLFDGATAFVPGQEWGLDETAERLILAGALPPLIIVAVDHGVERRLDEFSPTRDKQRRAGGAADRYGRMLVDELKPFIDANYRTLPGPSTTALGGSSMGGLVTLYLGLTRPGTFGRLAVMSPSVWWDDRVIVRQVERLERRPPLRIWLDVGTAEGEKALEDVRALKRALIAAGWQEGVDLHYLEAADASHSETAWAARVAPMLEFLFG
jgi:predicted alpha/beta superfamily hydrolase